MAIGIWRGVYSWIVLIGASLLLFPSTVLGQQPPASWDIVAQTDIEPLGYSTVLLQTTNTRGDVFLTSLSSDGSGKLTGFLFSEGEAREIFSTGESIQSSTGQPLGVIQLVESALLFHNGTLLLEALFLPEGASSDSRSLRFLTFDGAGFELTDLPSSRTLTGPFLSRRMTVSGRYLMADRSTTNGVRTYHVMNGIDEEGSFSFQQVDGSVTREIFDHNDDFILLYQKQFTVLASNLFGEPTRVRELWQLDFRNNEQREIVAVGSNEQEFEYSFGFFGRERTTVSATGQVLEKAWLSDTGEVIAAIRDARVNETPVGYREPVLQRLEAGGVSTPIYDMNTSTPFNLSLSGVIAALPGGAALVFAQEAATERSGFFALTPGGSQAIVRTGDTIDGSEVRAFPSSGTGPTARRIAEGALAFTYRLQPSGGADRIAVALPPNSGLVAWKQGDGGDWSGAANWSPTRVPAADEQTLFDIPGVYSVNVGSQQSGRLRIERGLPLFTGADLTIAGELAIGGATTLEVSGGQLGADSLAVGHLSRLLADGFAISRLRLEGETTLTVAAETVVGARAGGELTIGPGSSLFSQSTTLGRQGPGTVTVAGFMSAEALVLGAGGKADLKVEADGSMFTLSALVGGPAVDTRELAFLLMKGNWDNAGDLVVGDNQDGFVLVSGGTLSQLGDLKIGVKPNTQTQSNEPEEQRGTVLVSAGGVLEVSGDLQVGRDGGSGALATQGGEVRVTQGLAVPFRGAGSIGSLRIEDNAPVRAKLQVGAAISFDGAPCLVGFFGLSGRVVVSGGGLWECSLVTLGGEGLGIVVIDGAGGGLNSELFAQTVCVGGGGRREDQTLLCGSPNASFANLIVQNGGEVRTVEFYVGPLGRVVGDGIIFTTASTIKGTLAPGVDLFEAEIPVLFPVSSGGTLRIADDTSAKMAVLDFVSAPERDDPSPAENTLQRSVAFSAAASPLSNHDSPTPATLTLTGDVVLDAGATIELDIWGPDPSLHDRLLVDGSLDLNGATLVLNFRGGYTPAEGDLLSLVESSDGVTGVFGNVVLNGLGDGFDFRIDLTGGVVLLVALNDATDGDGPGNDVPVDPPVDATPVPSAIPTLSQWGLTLLILILLLSGLRARARKPVQPVSGG